MHFTLAYFMRVRKDVNSFLCKIMCCTLENKTNLLTLESYTFLFLKIVYFQIQFQSKYMKLHLAALNLYSNFHSAIWSLQRPE